MEDQSWTEQTGLTMDTLKGSVETVVFMSERPVALDKIKDFIDPGVPLRVLHEALKELQEEYERRWHGIRLVEVAGGYHFRTKAAYAECAKRLVKSGGLALSPTALEVLAAVAYRQPITKIEIDKIRGVDSGHILRGLIDKRLVKSAGNSDGMGAPVLYRTTPEFLEVFNLAGLEDLPPQSDLSGEEIGENVDIKTLIRDKSRFVFDETEEIDQLAQSIKAVPVETKFTASLKSEEGRHKKGEPRALSAFDILERHIWRQMIVEVNREAQNSRLPTGFVKPRVVRNFPLASGAKMEQNPQQ